MAAVSFVPFFGGMKLIVFMSKNLQKSCSYQLSSKEFQGVAFAKFATNLFLIWHIV